MARLHVTGVITVFIEIRLYIPASSKDIIHSWVIPSLGVKIGCTVRLFIARSLQILSIRYFWGQCMCICGRFRR